MKDLGNTINEGNYPKQQIFNVGETVGRKGLY